MNRKLAVAITAAALALGACTSSVTQPAAPKTPKTIPSTAAASSEPAKSTRNPYEAGATRDWNIDLEAEPFAVTYDRQSGTAVAALNEPGGVTLHAFQISNSGRAVASWSYALPQDDELLKIDAASGRVYISTASAGSGQNDPADQADGGQEASAAARSDRQPSDLIVLDARRGKESFRWAKANALDTDVPYLVGAYDSGAGIVKQGREKILAAIVDDTGKVTNDERLFILDDAAGAISIEADLVNTSLPPEGPQHPLSGTASILYPHVGIVSGADCWATSDGAVCVGVAREESNESGKKAAKPKITEPAPEGKEAHIVEYDERANVLHVRTAGANSAALRYAPVALNSDVTAKELAEALAQPVADAAQPGGEDAASQDSAGGQTQPDTEAKDGGAPAKNEAGGVAEGGGEQTAAGTDVVDLFAAERVPAMLHAGKWTELDGSDQPLNLANMLLERGAPYTASGMNVLTGEKVAEGTVIVGSGNSADMFFEWDGQTLHYLKPKG